MPDDQKLSTRDLVGATATEGDARERDDSDAQGDAARMRSPLSDPMNREAARERTGGGEAGGDDRSLLPGEQTDAFQERWTEIQTRFVDDPQQAVQDADALVADLMHRLAETFANERSSLEEQWSSGGDVNTEQLRVALQRYRAFFQRLLST